MTETTLGNLGLSGNFASGAEGWDVDMNHDLRMLDTLTMGTVLAAPLNDPPGSPTFGDTYIVGTAPTGLWASNANDVAVWTKSESDTLGWEFYTPKNGWEMNCLAGGLTTYLFIGGAWSALSNGGISIVQGGAPLSGVNTVILGANLSASSSSAGTVTLTAANGGGGGATTLDELTDVNATDGEAIDGDLFMYQQSSGKWIPVSRASLRTGNPVTYHCYWAGTLTAGQTLLTIDVAAGEAAAFAANLAGSILKLDTGCASVATTFTLTQNGTTVATGVVPEGSSQGTITAEGFSDATADVLRFGVSGTPDAAAAGVRFALNGTLQ